MRRSAPLRRRRVLVSRSPIRESNPERQAKKRKAYAAYLKSPTWKAKKAERMRIAGGQCEGTLMGWDGEALRCAETDKRRLQGHHTRYPKVLGTESVDTLRIVCRWCHEQLESAKWWRVRRRGRA